MIKTKNETRVEPCLYEDIKTIEKTRIGLLLEFTPEKSGAGMTRERERELRLLVGATLCGRPKTTTGKWQLIIKNSSTQRGEDKGEGG